MNDDRCLLPVLQDRLSTAADHSHVVQDDPAAAARLRLALAAALQSANLAAPSSKTAKAAKLGPLQGLDAAGVSDYINHVLQEVVQAAQGAQHGKAGPAAANGTVGSHSKDDSDEEQEAAAGTWRFRNLRKLARQWQTVCGMLG